MPEHADWASTADLAWYKRVLRVLQRDFADIADIAWSRAIDENAAEIAARDEPLTHVDMVCTTCRKPVRECPNETCTGHWKHVQAADQIACFTARGVRGSRPPVKAMVAAGNENVPRDA